MWDHVVGGEHSQWNSDFLYGLWKYNPSKDQKIKRPLSESSSESEHETNKNFYQKKKKKIKNQLQTPL